MSDGNDNEEKRLQLESKKKDYENIFLNNLELKINMDNNN